MKFSYLTILSIGLSLAIGIASCGNSSTDESDKSEVEQKDTATTETEEATENGEEDVIIDEEKVIVANPENTSIEAFEKTNEGGMSFCECVKKSQEMDDEMMADETSEERMEEIMKEKDKLVDGPCAILKVGGQSSPEEREARQRKVKACLSK